MEMMVQQRNNGRTLEGWLDLRMGSWGRNKWLDEGITGKVWRG